MGILSRLFQFGNKRKPAPAAPEQQKRGGREVAPQLEKALQAMLANNYPRAILRASKFIYSKAPDIMADAHRISAISYSRLDNYEKAFEHYLCLFELQEDAHTALQLATTSVMCREVQRRKAWFIKFGQLNDEKPEMPLGAAITNFITALTSQGYREKRSNISTG